jgi:DNA-binding GntR family transcriptional regulator
MRNDIAPLAAQIALDIVDKVAHGRLKPGDALREAALAESHKVSRSPVREALHALTELKITLHQPHRGVVIAGSISSRAIRHAKQKLVQSDAEEPYRKIAADRLSGRLLDELSEAGLGRRYKLNRAETRRIIARMAQEGWIERRPGYGWHFMPVLTTAQDFSAGYRFRLAVEPAGLLEPTFKINAHEFARFRAEQFALVEGRIHATSSVELFRLGSRFHEMLAKCSGNPFFFDALQRINRLRRLIEYRAMVETSHFIDQAREHLQIMDLIERGDREGAATLLARHLEKARVVKLDVLTSRKNERRSVPTTARLHF